MQVLYMSEVIFSIFPSKNFIDLGLYQFGWEHCEPSHSFGPAMRNHFLFHYVISGTGTLIAENSKKNQFLILLKVVKASWFSKSNLHLYRRCSTTLGICLIEFDGLRAKETVELSGLCVNSPVYKAKYKDVAQTMKDEMLYIINHKDDSPFHLIGHLYLLSIAS